MNEILSHLILQSVPLDTVRSNFRKVFTCMSFLHPKLENITTPAIDSKGTFHTEQTPKCTDESYRGRTRQPQFQGNTLRLVMSTHPSPDGWRRCVSVWSVGMSAPTQAKLQTEKYSHTACAPNVYITRTSRETVCGDGNFASGYNICTSWM